MTRADCGGDCGSCERCREREAAEEAAFYAKQEDEERALSEGGEARE